MKYPIFKPSDVNPYVTAVIHKNWNFLNKQHELYSELRQQTITELLIVNSTYYISNRMLIIFLSSKSCGYGLYNGLINKSSLHILGISNILFDLKRIYGQVDLPGTGTMCSTSVNIPNGHDIMDAERIVGMVREWAVHLDC